MLLFSAFLVLILFLVGFLLTCKLRAKKGPNYDDLAQNEGEDIENEMEDMSPKRKQRYSGLESESDDEETYQY